MAYILGMNAKLYYGTAEAALASLNPIDNVKDLTLALDAGEADITTRANSGWRATAATLREATLTWDMLWDTADTAFTAIKDAYLGGTTLEFAALDQGKLVGGSQGLKGAFSITSFTRNEPIEEALTVSVTAKLSTFSEWVEVT